MISNSITITIAVPEAHIAIANQFALCVGYGAGDAQTFRAASWQDGAGNLYAVASGAVAPAFFVDALAPLAMPPWGADLAAAGEAQAMIVLHELDGADPAGAETAAGPDQITAVVCPDPYAAVSAMGLTVVPTED